MRHCVRWAPSPPRLHSSPHFWAHVYCGQTAEWINMPLGIEVGLSSGHTRWGTQLRPRKRHSSPHFSAHVHCGQTAWIKMPLGMEVWPRPRRHCVRWGPSSATMGRPPILGPCLLWPNSSIDEAVTSYGGTPRPRLHCVRWGPSSPNRWHNIFPTFRPTSIMAK